MLALLTLLGCHPAPTADTGVVLSTWVDIPEGDFLMGCEPERDEDCGGDELPAHTVTLSAYAILRAEVTVGDYAACVDAGACDAPTVLDLAATEPELPVTTLRFAEAQAFCAWLGGSLPTEAQWEKAARGTDGRLYPWGDDPPDCGRVAARACGTSLSPVGAFPDGASPYGVLDLAGNAWERVSDPYSATWYAESPSVNPTGPDRSGVRGLRGSDAYFGGASLRASNRSVAIVGSTSPYLGFRCVR